jgi:DNA-binding IscR family transcriptional regulator
MKTKLISKPIWNLDYSKGGYYKSRVFNINHIVNNKFVQAGTEERHYNILLHLGEIITDFKTNKGTFEIRMLPLHYHIINNPNDFVTNLHNYDPKFFKKPKLYETDYLNKIFNQLVQNNILEMTNATPEGCFQINKDYDGGDLDLIELLDEYEENDSIIKTMMKEVSLERKEIIMANVNSFLKKYDTFVEKITVYNHINETLKMYFDIEKEYFDNVLNEMVDKEYICYQEKSKEFLKKLI